MDYIRLLAIYVLQISTSFIQIKGVPKVILLIKHHLFREDQIYNVYNKIQLKIYPDVGFHCLNILNYGGFETVLLYEKFLKKGDVYIDIGANLGYMSLNAEKIVGKEGKVLSFEPDTKILPLLKKNKFINNSDIIIIENAVSDHTGIEIFNIATESGLSRLNNAHNNLVGLELFEQIEVKTDTLDNFINELIPNRPVKLIKIDVEGLELRILRGAVNSLKNYCPVLILEINHGAMKENDVSLIDILNFLNDFSYNFYFINSHAADWFRLGRKPTFELIDNNYKEFEGKYFDLLCLSNKWGNKN